MGKLYKNKSDGKMNKKKNKLNGIGQNIYQKKYIKKQN